MQCSRNVVSFLAMVLCAESAGASLSPSAQFIRDREYRALSSKEVGQVPVPVDPLLVKASGIVPSVYDGLVAWADGRTGAVGIWGYDLRNLARGEFIISDMTSGDGFQEGNPFVSGWNVPQNPPGSGGGTLRRPVVTYDCAHISGGTEPGNVLFATDGGTSPWNYHTATAQPLTQRSPVYTNGMVVWVDDRNDAATSPADRFPGVPNTDIYAQQVDPATGGLIGPELPISTSAAPQDRLAADNGIVVWQELRRSASPFSTDSSWDIAGYDFATGTLFDVFDDTTSGPAKNQIDPDISGNLVVWTQEEDPGGTGATNIYILSLLNAGAGPIPVTTTGTAAHPAVSMGPDGNFVVWQDYRLNRTPINYLGGNGEIDFQWDIWAQEVADDGTLVGDPFVVCDDPGRQTNPDIHGLDVVWQSQGLEPGSAPVEGSEDIYVFGPVPEPLSVALLVAGAPLLLLRSRRRQATR